MHIHTIRITTNSFPLDPLESAELYRGSRHFKTVFILKFQKKKKQHEEKTEIGRVVGNSKG